MPCTECGRSPLLAGRFRLDRSLDERGTVFATTDLRVGSRPGSILLVPAPAGAAQEVAAALDVRLAPLRSRAPVHLATPGRPFAHAFGKQSAVCLPGAPLRGRSVGLRYRRNRSTHQGQIALLQGVLTALEALHELAPPMVHGAVAPTSVFLDETGRPTLIGAGIMDVGLHPGWRRPPVPDTTLTPATDLCMLGLTVLATARGVSVAEVVGPTGAVVWDNEVGLHPLLSGLLQRLTNPDPSARPATAGEALVMLRRVQDALGAHPEAAEMLHEVLTGPIVLSPETPDEPYSETAGVDDGGELPSQPTVEVQPVSPPAVTPREPAEEPPPPSSRRVAPLIAVLLGVAAALLLGWSLS